ncbi:hypothetical protein GCM10010182_05700 [Actinomadura cremea]|nr:hypothetical protein GCM10010182_05700 [Actinomadura cremea]
MLLSLYPDPEVKGDPLLLVAGAGLVALSPLLAVTGSGFRGVILTPELVIVRLGLAGSAVRLSRQDISFVLEYDVVGNLTIGLVPLDPTVLGMGRRARVWAVLGFGGAKVDLPAGHFATDPALLLLALRYYHAHPGDRPELGTRKAIERIKAGRLLD